MINILPSNYVKKIVNSMPESFYEKYNNATKSEKLIMIKMLSDLIVFSANYSGENNKRAYFQKNLGIDIFEK